MEKKIHKIILVSQKNVSENVAINFLFSEENTCHQLTMG